jgi:hypothetical protein
LFSRRVEPIAMGASLYYVHSLACKI